MSVRRIVLASAASLVAMVVLLASAAGAAGGAGGDGEITDHTFREYYQMPALFHLDDYDACLSQQAAVYCVGSFHLAPAAATAPATAPANATATPHNKQYAFIKEFSERATSFNHTRLHRGYCLTSRCGADPGDPDEGGGRLERCVSSWTRRRWGLEATLLQPGHCTAAADARRAPPYDLPDAAFAGALLLLLAANVLGTCYDLFRDQRNKGNKMLLAWSVRANWRRLVAGDARGGELSAIDGFRVFATVPMVAMHSYYLLFTTYLQNPLHLEKTSVTTLLFLTNLSITVELYVVISSFVFAHNLLQHERRAGAEGAAGAERAGGLATLPRRMLRRVARIGPSYWVVVGFAATWWRRAGSGPLWQPLVGAEAERCRRKWWPHVFFLNNIVEPDRHCLLPTWFLASDMQLHLASAALLLWLARPRGSLPALPALAAALALATAAIYHAAAHYGVREIVFNITFETLRVTFSDSTSFSWLYISWWGNAGASLLGLALAVVLRDHQRRGVDPKQYKMVVWCCRLSVPLCMAWVWAGVSVARGAVGAARAGGGAAALYTALARPGASLLACFFIYGLYHDIDPSWRWLRWPQWRVLSRLSLSVSLLHWCINLTLIAARPTLAHFSALTMTSEVLFVWTCTHLAALPLTLLVQYPAQHWLRELL